MVRIISGGLLQWMEKVLGPSLVLKYKLQTYLLQGDSCLHQRPLDCTDILKSTNHVLTRGISSCKIFFLGIMFGHAALPFENILVYSEISHKLKSYEY